MTEPVMTHSGPIGPKNKPVEAPPEPQVSEVNQSAVVLRDDDELQERERRRKVAILKAVGLDKVPEEQRELALAIARRYDLDLMLKHLVLVDGRPYITRDALLYVAHRSGVFDGMELVEGPELRDFPEVGKCWYAVTAVYRRDMSRPFKMPGRYPVGGRNKTYGPEMAIKVSESMALRRAFDVSAATVEEQWEQATDAPEPQQPQSLAAKVAARVEQIEHPKADEPPPAEPDAEPASSDDADSTDEPEQADADLEALVERHDAESVSMGLVDEQPEG